MRRARVLRSRNLSESKTRALASTRSLGSRRGCEDSGAAEYEEATKDGPRGRLFPFSGKKSTEALDA